MYRLRGVSSKNWSRQSDCKCCWKTRLQNIMSDPRTSVDLVKLAWPYS